MTRNLLGRSRAARAWLPAVGGLAALALAAAGCGGSYGGGHAAAGSSATASSSSGGSAAVNLATTKLGKVLVDGNGRTLYLFQADQGPDSMCGGACAQAWPPLTTKGRPTAGTGVSAAKLATARRADGRTEVTYNGHPLYTYVGDRAPGQTAGEESRSFGAEWDVLSAAGAKITLDGK